MIMPCLQNFCWNNFANDSKFRKIHKIKDPRHISTTWTSLIVNTCICPDLCFSPVIVRQTSLFSWQRTMCWSQTTRRLHSMSVVRRWMIRYWPDGVVAPGGEEGVDWGASVTISYTNNFSGRATCSKRERGVKTWIGRFGTPELMWQNTPCYLCMDVFHFGIGTQFKFRGTLLKIGHMHIWEMDEIEALQ